MSQRPDLSNERNSPVYTVENDLIHVREKYSTPHNTFSDIYNLYQTLICHFNLAMNDLQRSDPPTA